MSLIDRIKNAVVTGAHLSRANDLAGESAEAAIAEGQPVDFLTLMGPIMNEFLGELSPEQITAISFRLQALSTLIVKREAESWTLRLNDESEVYIQESVYQAAAAAKLDITGEPCFDREEFLALVLRCSDAEGRA